MPWVSARMAVSRYGLGVAVLMRMTLSIETRTSKNPGAVPQTSLPGTRAVDVTNAHRAGENLFISNLGSA